LSADALGVWILGTSPRMTGLGWMTDVGVGVNA